MRHYSRSFKDSDAKTYEDPGSKGFRGDSISGAHYCNIAANFFLLPKNSRKHFQQRRFQDTLILSVLYGY